jgi:hypothetical protein
MNRRLIGLTALGLVAGAVLIASTPALRRAMQGDSTQTSEASEPVGASNANGPAVIGGASTAAALQTPVAPDVQVAAGTALHVRLNRAIGTKEDRTGARFTATLEEPLRVGRRIVVPRGAEVQGVVEESRPSGRLKGHAELVLALRTIDVEGHSLRLSTTVATRSSGAHKRRNLAWIGGGGGGGALIGGLAGGPAGMLIGAGSGAAAGLAGAAVTGKKQVYLPAETRLSFRLSQPLAVPAAVVARLNTAAGKA